MSGFVRNDWGRYLNGGTSQYNFSYKSEAPPAPLEPSPAPVPAPMPTPAPMPAPTPNASPSKKNNKNKIVFPVQKEMKGGRRKSRRSKTKKHRRTHRK